MLRYMLAAVVIMGAVMVLLAGVLGDLASFPVKSAGHSASVARNLPLSTQGTSQDPPPSTLPPSASYDGGTAQPAIDALHQQLAQLQQQVDQRDKQLDAVRSDTNAEQQKLTALKQQRQSEEAAVTQLQAQHQQLSAEQAEASSASAQASAAAAQRQAANAALQKQSADLQAQIKQQFEQLAMLRTNMDQERRALDTLHQQRRTEEDAVARLQSQKAQMASVVTPAPVSPPQAKRPAPVNPETPPNDTMQGAVAQLRARQRDVQPAPPGVMPTPQKPQVYALNEPRLIVSTKGVLITARELVASGRLGEARDLLLKARADSALRPVTPDQPNATGVTAVSNQIGAAINFLEVGNSGRALDAINLAMDNVGTGARYAPAYSATAVTEHYPYSSYYDGEARR